MSAENEVESGTVDPLTERPKPEPTAYGRLVDKMVATVATWPSEYQRSVDVHHLHPGHAGRA
jgi:hypothetical protein